jgi:hypothetical protein
MQLQMSFIDPDLTDAEIQFGALRLFYPREDRMLWVAPVEILFMYEYALESIFNLTKSEAQLMREKAGKLNKLNELRQ